MKIGVIMGGISTEREISLKTGENMFRSLDREKYEPVKIILDSKDDIFHKAKDIDFALLALHGKFGEDGVVQSILDAMGIPYSGSDVKSSAVAMDKDLSKKLLKEAGIRTADWITVSSPEEAKENALPFIEKYGKVVVKPNSGGSSVMTFITDDKDELIENVEEALTVDHEIMVEQYIKGDEITVPIVDGKTWPTLLIKASEGFFDYTAKYKDPSQGGASEEVTELEENLQKEVNDLTVRTYNALKCSVYGRVDLLVSDGKPYVLEINTLPGMTATSLIPKSAKALGMDYPELLDLIISLSVKQRKKEEEFRKK